MIAVNSFSNTGVKYASIIHTIDIRIILIINIKIYLPKKFLKSKLLFLNNAFKNFTEALIAKKLKYKYIIMFNITAGKTYKNEHIIPLTLYFKIMVASVVPNINPLKNNITITAIMPIIEMPNAKIINNWIKLLISSLPKYFIPKTLLENDLIFSIYVST